MTDISAKIVASSMTNGIVIDTYQLRYPRFIHSEFMTHRVFSRNASSSRAIPVRKMLQQVWHSPAEPIHWGQNIPGMQANEELQGAKLAFGRLLWRTAAKVMCGFVWAIDKLGGHKQWANRLLEPWQYISVIVTATDWENFYELRLHKDAQPEMRRLAEVMWAAKHHYPSVDRSELSGADAWHLPYVMESERAAFPLKDLIAMSAARCARVSYLNHDGSHSTLTADKNLYARLVESKPAHASPIEHQAVFFTDNVYHYNLRGWASHRYLKETGLAGEFHGTI